MIDGSRVAEYGESRRLQGGHPDRGHRLRASEAARAPGQRCERCRLARGRRRAAARYARTGLEGGSRPGPVRHRATLRGGNRFTPPGQGRHWIIDPGLCINRQRGRSSPRWPDPAPEAIACRARALPARHQAPLAGASACRGPQGATAGASASVSLTPRPVRSTSSSSRTRAWSERARSGASCSTGCGPSSTDL